MAEAFQTQVVLHPPHPQMAETDLFQLLYELWHRSGGFNNAVTNLEGLIASVKELNTLVGIDTGDTVQEQLNSKQPIGTLGTMAFQNSNAVNVSGGTIANTTHNSVIIQNSSTFTSGTISNSIVTFPTGSITTIYPGGRIHYDTTAVATVDALENDLITYSLQAATVNTNGYFLEITASGTIAANANNKTIKLYLGSTLLLTTGAVAANSGSWEIKATIIRTGASQEKCSCSIISSNNLIIDSNTYTLAAENLNTTLTIKCTGQGTAAGDITQELLIIKLFK